MEDVSRQLQVLEKLRQVEIAVRDRLLGLQKIPLDLEKLEASGRANGEAFKAAEEALKTLEKDTRAAELDLKSKEAEIDKAEGRLSDVKTNEEFRAAQKEIETRRQTKSELEDNVLAFFAMLDEKKAALKVLSAEHRLAIEHLTAVAAKSKVQLVELQADLDRLNAGRKELAKELGEPLTTRYLAEVQKKGPITIAIARNGSCANCHMQVRPQAFNEILGAHAIHQCGHCLRFLVPDPRNEPGTLVANQTSGRLDVAGTL